MADPKLVVALEARLEKFEKQMKEAGVIADRGVKDIEDKFSKANPKVNFLEGIFQGLGQFAGQAIEKLVSQAIKSITTELAKLGDSADLIELTTDRLQELRFAFLSLSDLNSGEFLKGIESIGTKINEAATEENKLSQLFAANNIAIKDRAGNLINVNDALVRAATLVQNAKDKFDEIKIVDMLGLSRDWIRALRQGPEALEEMARKARESGLIIDKELIVKAREFRDTLNRIVTIIEAKLQVSLTALAGAMEELVTKGTALAAVWGAMDQSARFIAALASSAKMEAQGIEALTEAQIKLMLETGLRTESENEALRTQLEILEKIKAAREGTPLRIVVKKPAPANPTVIPVTGKGGGGGDTKDSFDRQTDSINKHIAAMEADARAAGLGAAKQAEFRAEAALTQAVLRDGGDISDYADRIKKLAAAAGLAADNLEKARDKAPLADFARDAQNLDKQLTQLSISGLRSIEDGFADIIMGTKSVADAFKDMAQSIIRDLIKIMIQKSITGPLAEMLGGLGGLGNLGGGGAPAAQHAGGTAYSRGGATLVGESGPELVRLPRGSQVTPNHIAKNMGGGGGASMSVNIINTAPGVEVEQRPGSDAFNPQFVIKQIEASMAGNIAGNRGPLRQAIRASVGNRNLAGA